MADPDARKALPLLSVSSFNIEQWKHSLTEGQWNGRSVTAAPLLNRSSEFNYEIMYSNSSQQSTQSETTASIVAICIVSALASVLTVGGNVMVIVSFVINRSLRTVNNYLLLSLAAADLLIGLVSMNLFTVFIVSGSWNLGAVLCDLWLALDYVASNASVMNLLIICLDRYYSVTKPVEYRNRRTPKRFITAIVGAWSISFILWAPWVLFWQFIVNERTVPHDNCYVQFIKDSKPMAVITALAAFYLPATVMCVLYWKVYLGIKNRRKKLLRMKEIKVAKDNSIISGSEEEHPSNSSESHLKTNLKKDEKMKLNGKGITGRVRGFFQRKRDILVPNENNFLLGEKRLVSKTATPKIDDQTSVAKPQNGTQALPVMEVPAVNLDEGVGEEMNANKINECRKIASSQVKTLASEIYKNENAALDLPPVEPQPVEEENVFNDSVFVSPADPPTPSDESPTHVLKNYDADGEVPEPCVRMASPNDVTGARQMLVAVIRQRHGYIEEKVEAKNTINNMEDNSSDFESFDCTNGNLIIENNAKSPKRHSFKSYKGKTKRRRLPSLPAQPTTITPQTKKFVAPTDNGSPKIPVMDKKGTDEAEMKIEKTEDQEDQGCEGELEKKDSQSIDVLLGPPISRSEQFSTSAITKSYQSFVQSPSKENGAKQDLAETSSRSRTNSGKVMFIRRQIKEKKSSDTESAADAGGVIKVTERLKLQVVKKKLQSLNKETKAARLLASILAAFILLWLPYNIMALIEAFCPLSEKCIPDLAWSFGYWSCYLNSTLNPVCYAMCNKNFQQTFKFLLSLKWIHPDHRRFRPQMV
ncbi:muscarinic acetylcholine receptor M5-like [Ciona intestinalis]